MAFLDLPSMLHVQQVNCGSGRAYARMCAIF